MSGVSNAECLQELCTRRPLNNSERGLCYAHDIPLRCELTTCTDWLEYPWQTCKTHTNLLRRLGHEPLRLAPNSHGGLKVVQDNEDHPTRIDIPFKLSASYVSRYSNCHGSANLALAIPGFEHPERNDNGMKGEGTRLHRIFEECLSDPSNLLEKSTLLKDIAALWGPKRVEFLKDEKKFIISWFMRFKTAPPIECPVLYDNLVQYVNVKDTDGNDTDTLVAKSVPPRRILFLAEALEYVHDLMQSMDEDTLELVSEATRTVDWLTTRPRTTVDLIVKDKERIHVIDLKMGDIEVSPINNEQLMYYAVTFGALDYDRVFLHIIQRNHTDWWEPPKKVLQTWMKTVQESEAAILAQDLTLSPGEHCKFCPANPHGRGDYGNKSCPAMLSLLYGEHNKVQADKDVLEYEDE